MYWKYDEVNKMMHSGYPKDMSAWPGVPIPVDAAMTTQDGACVHIDLL